MRECPLRPEGSWTSVSWKMYGQCGREGTGACINIVYVFCILCILCYACTVMVLNNFINPGHFTVIKF